MRNRFAVLVAPEKFEIKKEDITCGNDQVLVKISACGICKWEMNHFEGKLGSFPQRIGHEPSGIVEEVGENVRNFEVGDRVTGLFYYGFSQYTLADPKYLVKIPEGIQTEYALGEPLKCVVTCARAASPKFGDYVLLFGCGFMGLLTLRCMKGNAPAEIIAVDLIDSRLRLAKDLGATTILNPAEKDVEKEVIDITDGRGVDIAIDATGKPEPVNLASKLVRVGRGKLILIGTQPYGGAFYDLSHWIDKSPIVLNPHPGYSLDPMGDLRRAMEGLKRGVFPMERLITHKFSLEEIEKAFIIARSSSQGYIKGIIVP